MAALAAYRLAAPTTAALASSCLGAESRATGSSQLASSTGRTSFHGGRLAAVTSLAQTKARRHVRRSIQPQARQADVGDDISQTLIPPAQFYKVEAIIRPWRLQFVAQALVKMGIRGVTVTDVRGFGAQGGSRERQAGSEFTDDKFVSKAKVEIVVVYEQVEEVVGCIIGEARTGEIGDGKIFISPVSDVIRVRTGERGIKAERMAGGRMELLAAKTNGSS